MQARLNLRHRSHGLGWGLSDRWYIPQAEPATHMFDEFGNDWLFLQIIERQPGVCRLLSLRVVRPCLEAAARGCRHGVRNGLRSDSADAGCRARASCEKPVEGLACLWKKVVIIQRHRRTSCAFRTSFQGHRLVSCPASIAIPGIDIHFAFSFPSRTLRSLGLGLGLGLVLACGGRAADWSCRRRYHSLATACTPASRAARWSGIRIVVLFFYLALAFLGRAAVSPALD